MCEQDILKTTEQILMPIGTSRPRGNNMKR